MTDNIFLSLEDAGLPCSWGDWHCSILNQESKMNTTITTDFYLTAYLLSENIPLVRHTRSNNKSTFEFTGDNISEIIEKYYSGNALVSINKYAEAIRALKNIMYNDTSIHQPNNNYERQYS